MVRHGVTSKRSPRVTVIIPTHNHATTVDLAVESALNQTVSDLDVVVIGDGVTDDTRDAVRSVLGDDRVRFLDRPKSRSRAEATRHEVLSSVCSPFVCYLGDDDLLLRDHVEQMIGLLAEADFAHPLPLLIDRDGSLRAHPTDLTRPECVQWHLRAGPQHNAISLTGAAHRLDAYHRLPYGWLTPPAGTQSDLFMWRQWFQMPGLRFVTGSRLTVLKLEASVRQDMSCSARRLEMLSWKARAEKDGFADELSHLAADAFRRFAIETRLVVSSLEDQVEASIIERDNAVLQLREHVRVTEADHAAALAGLEKRIDAIAVERDAAHAGRETALGERDAARAELDATRATLTWRLRDRLIRLPGVARLVRLLRSSA
jgi:glycosyltransferase involved in cell wall biosynthesis